MSNFLEGARDLKTYLMRTYHLVQPFWQSELRKRAWYLLLAVLAIQGFMVYLSAKNTYISRAFMDAMVARNVDETWLQLGLYIGIFAASAFMHIFNVHFKNLLIIYWRRYMTKVFLTDYLHANLYNQLELKNYDLDNPDQRISQDLFNLANETLELGIDILMNVSKAIVFGVILWRVSGALEFSFAGTDFVIPGYMFWIAAFYSVLVSWAAHRFSHPMSRLNFELQAVEADFRHRLVRLREHAESVALLQGENREATNLQQKFGSIWDNWMLLLRYKRRLAAVQSAYLEFLIVVPYVAAMPAFIAGTVTFGGFTQLGMVFGRFSSAATWFLSAYERLAVWKSSVDRVTKLQDALHTAGKEREQSPIIWSNETQPEFEVDNLRLDLPSGERLLEDIKFSLETGRNIVVTGPSGSGKSTLFKALSGLWVWGEGKIQRPEGDVMFLPQKPYLPIDTLRNALAYPNSPDEMDDARLRDVMDQCLLGQFVDQLDESCDWARVLSGGEQQRLSFVRAILTRPDWLFLDEATAALDPATEAAVYAALRSELPHTTLVSIAHRESLKKYHDLELRIDAATQSMSITELQPV